MCSSKLDEHYFFFLPFHGVLKDPRLQGVRIRLLFSSLFEQPNHDNANLFTFNCEKTFLAADVQRMFHWLPRKMITFPPVVTCNHLNVSIMWWSGSNKRGNLTHEYGVACASHDYVKVSVGVCQRDSHLSYFLIEPSSRSRVKCSELELFSARGQSFFGSFMFQTSDNIVDPARHSLSARCSDFASLLFCGWESNCSAWDLVTFSVLILLHCRPMVGNLLILRGGIVMP